MNTKRIFYAGNYYLVDTENRVVAHSDNMKDIKDIAQPTDTILVALTAEGSHIYDPFVDEVITMADRIIIDFEKNILTVEGNDVILFDKEFKVGVNKLDKDDLEDWPDLIEDGKRYAEVFEIIGNPPIEGKDITNEMSDL